MRKFTVTLTLAALATLTAGTTAAAAPADASPGACSAVVHVGDSLSVGLGDEGGLPSGKRLPDRYAAAGIPEDAIHYDASGGRSIVEKVSGNPNGVEAVNAATTATPTVDGRCWVIALGTNDAANISAGSAVNAADRIDRIMSAVPEGDPVMWVDVATSGTAPKHWAPANMEKFREALTAAEGKHDNLRVAKWSEQVEDSLFSDGIHFTTAGYDKLADFIVGELTAAAQEAPEEAEGEGAVPAEGDKPLAGETIKLAGDESDQGTKDLKAVLEAAGATIVLGGGN